MSQLSPFTDPFAPAPQAGPAKPAALPPLSEEEKQSLLERIGSAGLGGLSYVAGALNKPGRVIRGVLGGNFREALNAIPFSDALGITDPGQEVHGHDLLRNAGITTEKDPSFFSPEGLAGFGVDVLTDPLTYLTGPGHALTEAGKAAKKLNMLPARVAERLAGASPELAAASGGAIQVGERLGGHIGVGIPGFGNNLGTYDLRPAAAAISRGVRSLPGGNAVADLASGVGGAVGKFYNRTIPPLFQRSVMGQTDPAAQGIAREVTQQLPGVQAAARAKVGELTQGLPDVASGLTGEARTNALMQQGRELRQGLETLGPAQGPLAPAIEGQRALHAETLAEANRLGAPDMPLADTAIGYAERHNTMADQGRVSQFGTSLKPTSQLPEREKLFKGLYTEQDINALTRDTSLFPLRDKYLAGDTAPLTDYVKQNVVKLDQNELDALRLQHQANQRGIGMSAPVDMDRLTALEAKAVQAQGLADYTANLPKQLAEAGLGAFDRHPHVDLEEGAVRNATRFLKMEGLHKSIAKMAYLDSEGAPLADVINRAGLTYKDAAGNSTAMARTLEAMQAEGKLPAGATIKDMEGWTIPHDQVDRLTRFVKASTAPAGLAPFLNLFDSVTNLTKAFQTTIWPANWVRNKGQALFQNWIHDGFNAQAEGAMRYVKPQLDAVAWRNGKAIEGASQYPGLQHLTDEGATAVLNSEIKHFNVGSAFKNPEQDILGGEVSLRQLLPEAAGEARKPFSDIVKGFVPTSRSEANPLNVAGFNGRLEDTFAPVRAGRELSQESHAMDRVATYLAKRSQGYTPEAALAEVKLSHYDFANMSDFEKSTMKRLIPFYNFARQNIPAVIKELAENPGGKLGQTVKAVTAIKGDHPGFIPSYVGEGVAAPVGGEENGTQRYLTHLGLGFEDLGRLTGPGGPLGLLNPLIKGPIEAATGRQLFTGRDLSDLYSPIAQATGQSVGPLENILSNSPAGRFESTARTLADPRKSALDKILNTLTGARVSDVDKAQAERVAVRDYIANAMHGPGISQFADFSVKPENVGLLTPFQQQLLQLHRQLQRRNAPPLPTLQ